MEPELKIYLDEIVTLLLDGLTTDGGHHKQYYLEEVFKKLVTDEYFEKTKDHFEWEDGIPS